MNICTHSIKRRWIVITVWSQAQGVSDIKWKLPQYITRIKAIAFTLCDYEGEFTDQRIGELSLQCNNKLTHPLNWDIIVNPVQRIDKASIPLDVEIQGGTYVQGYYKNMSSKDHKLLVYLNCETI